MCLYVYMCFHDWPVFYLVSLMALGKKFTQVNFGNVWVQVQTSSTEEANYEKLSNLVGWILSFTAIVILWDHIQSLPTCRIKSGGRLHLNFLVWPISRHSKSDAAFLMFHDFLSAAPMSRPSQRFAWKGGHRRQTGDCGFRRPFVLEAATNEKKTNYVTGSRCWMLFCKLLPIFSSSSSLHILLVSHCSPTRISWLVCGWQRRESKQQGFGKGWWLSWLLAIRKQINFKEALKKTS